MRLSFKGDKRSVLAKKNIVAAAFFKSADTAIYLLLVPLTLGYLNPYEYGIWITLNSLLSWIDSFDIGLGNGLRNKLAIAVAEDDKERGRSYVSTTFYMLILIALFLFVSVVLLVNAIDFYSLLNVDKPSVRNLNDIIIFSFLFFCLNFVFKFVGNVYQALQLPSFNYVTTFTSHLLALIIIYVMTKTIPGSLIAVALVYSAIRPIIYIICYPITFIKIYPYLSPSLKFFKRDYLHDLLSLGAYFFLIQIMSIVLFSLSNVLISNLFGPDKVTPYNIVYRYFSIILILFNILLSPIWSATTDAYAKGDMAWIRNALNRSMKIVALVFLLIFIMIIVSGYVYDIWIGNSVEIPLSLSIWMGIYNIIILYSYSYSYFLNGMGVLRLQVINIICVAVVFCPICYVFAQFYGELGVLIGMCISHIPGALLNTVQLRKILNGTAHGLWRL